MRPGSLCRRPAAEAVGRGEEGTGGKGLGTRSGVPGVVAPSEGPWRRAGAVMCVWGSGPAGTMPSGGLPGFVVPHRETLGAAEGSGAEASSLRGKEVGKPPPKKQNFFFLISRSSNLRKTLPFLIRRLKRHEGVLAVAVFEGGFPNRCWLP